jgi:long-chain acyl-CoA synthetase
MELKHYLSYLQNTMTNKWLDLAMKDLDGATQYTYGELAEQIARLHTTFRLLGIKEGDKIALCGRNCSNWGVLFLATATYKAVTVSILPDFTAEGVHALVNHSEAKLLYTGPNVLKKIDVKEMPTLSAVILMDDFSMQSAANEEIEKAYAQVDSAFAEEFPNGYSQTNLNYPTDNIDELALLNYTSGSTGNPKGVMLTHKNLSGNIDFAVKEIPHKPGDKVLSMLPIAHMFGLMFEFLYQVCDGAEVYFLTKAPTPTTLMKAFAQVHPFMILTVPLVIEKIIKGKVLPIIKKPVMKVLWNTPGIKCLLHKKVRNTLLQAFGGELRFLIIGGAALNEEVEKCMHDMHFPYCVGYGMTECAPLISYAPWDENREGSCGRVVDRMEVYIDSADPYNIPGVLWVRGANVMQGYYKNQEATDAIFKDGWMSTGDICQMDEDGFIYIRGRDKNMILGPSGQNIYPEEIEQKLNNMPYVCESIVIDEDNKLVALVYPDIENATAQGISMASLEKMMQENIDALNKELPAYSQIKKVKVHHEEFEKTPKRSIKRYLYQHG